MPRRWRMGSTARREMRRVEGVEGGFRSSNHLRRVVKTHIPTKAKTGVPALTTVSVDPQGMGRKAAQLLLRHINSGDSEPEAIVSPVRLVIRESCGAARQEEFGEDAA